MNLLVDENLSATLVARLATKGVAAAHVAHIGLPGAKDPAVWARAYADDQIVVTMNAPDFLRLAADTELHPGLIIVRARRSLSRDEQWKWLEPAVDELIAASEDLVNKVVVITGPGKFNIKGLSAG